MSIPDYFLFPSSEGKRTLIGDLVRVPGIRVGERSTSLLGGGGYSGAKKGEEGEEEGRSDDVIHEIPFPITILSLLLCVICGCWLFVQRKL